MLERTGSGETNLRQIPVLGLAALLLLGATLLPRAAETPLPRPAAPPVAPAAAPLDPAAEADLFAMPRIVEASRAALQTAQAGDLAEAVAILDPLLAAHPGVGQLQASRAVLSMLAGDTDAVK